MSRYLGYEPLFEDDINYTECKWLCNEICCNDNSPYLADYPFPFCKCESKKDCEYFEKEDGRKRYE